MMSDIVPVNYQIYYHESYIFDLVSQSRFCLGVYRIKVKCGFMQVRKQQLELDMEQQTDPKLRKEYVRLYIVTLLI